MLSQLRTAHQARAKVARIFLAASLVLVLLAGVAPISALSSHLCHMPCCKGRAPHAEGSCSFAAFGDESEAEASDEQGDEHSVHHHAEHASSHQTSTGKETSETASTVSQVLTAPCSSECAAASIAGSPREASAVSTASRQHTSSPVLFKKDYSRIIQSSADTRRLSRPRAPPISLVNLSA